MKINITAEYHSNHPKYHIYTHDFSATQMGLAVAGDKLEDVTSSFRVRARKAVAQMKVLAGRTQREAPGKIHLADSFRYRVSQRETHTNLRIWSEAPHAVFVEYGTRHFKGKYFFRKSILMAFSDIIPQNVLFSAMGVYVS